MDGSEDTKMFFFFGKVEENLNKTKYRKDGYYERPCRYF
jgi:hypothetical protein